MVPLPFSTRRSGCQPEPKHSRQPGRLQTVWRHGATSAHRCCPRRAAARGPGRSARQLFQDQTRKKILRRFSDSACVCSFSSVCLCAVRPRGPASSSSTWPTASTPWWKEASSFVNVTRWTSVPSKPGLHQVRVSADWPCLTLVLLLLPGWDGGTGDSGALWSVGQVYVH